MQLLYIRRCWMLLTVLLCALQSSAQNEQDLKQRTAAYLFAGKYDEALQPATQLVAKFPGTENFMILGSVYEIKNDTINANLQYAKAIKGAGDDLYKVYADLCYIAYRRKHMVQAISYGEQSIKLQPNQPEQHYFLGVLYEAREQESAAREHFRQALEQDPDNTTYLKRMYVISYREGNVREAVGYLEKAVAKDSTDQEGRLSLVNGLMELDDYAKALALLRLPIADSIGGSRIWFAQAQCYFQLGDTLNGLTSLEKSFYPSYKQEEAGYQEAANIYAALRQYGKYLEIMQRGAAAGFKSFQKWIADYREATGEMRVIYREIGKGNAADNLYRLGKLYAAIDDYPNSLKLFQDYLSAGGVHTDSVWMYQAVGYFRLGSYREALQAIETALSLAPGNEDYAALRTVILYKMKDYGRMLGASKDLTTADVKGALKTSDTNNYLLFKASNALNRPKESAYWHRRFQQQMK